jgi:hypothetical protein
MLWNLLHSVLSTTLSLPFLQHLFYLKGTPVFPSSRSQVLNNIIHTHSIHIHTSTIASLGHTCPFSMQVQAVQVQQDLFFQTVPEMLCKNHGPLLSDHLHQVQALWISSDQSHRLVNSAQSLFLAFYDHHPWSSRYNCNSHKHRLWTTDYRLLVRLVCADLVCGLSEKYQKYKNKKEDILVNISSKH